MITTLFLLLSGTLTVVSSCSGKATVSTKVRTGESATSSSKVSGVVYSTESGTKISKLAAASPTVTSKEVPVGAAQVRVYKFKTIDSKPALIGATASDKNGQFVQVMKLESSHVLLVTAELDTTAIGQAIVVVPESAASRVGANISVEINIQSTLAAYLMLKKNVNFDKLNGDSIGAVNSIVAREILSHPSVDIQTLAIELTTSKTVASALADAVDDGGASEDRPASELNGMISVISSNGIAKVSITKVSVSPTTTSIVKGSSAALTSVATYSDGSTADITSVATWTSANEAVSMIAKTNSAVSAVGVDLGSTVISARFGGSSAEASITVTAGSLLSIAITPAHPTVTYGVSQQFAATGSYANGNTFDVTNSSVWTSSDTAVLVIGAGGGLVTPTGIGTATITVTQGLVSSSTVVTVTAQASPPNATGLSATVDSASQITLAWTSGGGSTANYKIAYQTGGTAPADCVSGTQIASASVSEVITSLSSSTQYSFRICAVNSNPTPDVSTGATVTATTLQAPAPNPSGLSATIDSTTQVTLDWTSGGGSTATYKIAYQSGLSAPTDCSSGTTTTSVGISKTISGLSSGTQYAFRVCALNSNSTPDISSGVSTTALTPETAPPNPTGLGMTVDSASQFTLAWSSGGGSTATYKIAYQSGATAPADCASGTTTTSVTPSKVISGLSSGTQYSFRVCALNSNGTPDVSSGVTLSATTLAAAPPNPSALSGAADSTTQITLGWTSGGGSTASYKIAYQSGATAPSDCTSGSTATSATNSKVITGLSVGTQYAFRVCALNGNATPDVSTGVTTSTATLQSAPLNPVSPMAVVDAPTQISVSWTSGGGSTASYKIAYDVGATAPPDCATGTTTTSATTSKAITGLTAGNQYSIRICALNSNGTPDVSSGVTVSTSIPLDAPPNPTGLSATIDSSTQITIDWTSGGGTTATYNIAYQIGATAPADCSSGTTTTAATTSKTLTGLTPATQYSFRVCAVNGNPTPDVSSGSIVSATIPQLPPPNPSGLGATVDSSTQITVAWTSGGGSTTSYKIAYQTGATAPADCASGTTTTSATTSKAIAGLTAGTQYAFRVCALNSNATPDESSGVTTTATIPQLAPPNPTNLGTTVDSSTQITVAWTSGGGSTASYKIAYQSGATAPADCTAGTVATSATTFKAITGLAATTQYSFRVCALNSNGTPDVSSGVTTSATTLQAAPPNPTSPGATVDSSTQITLAWTSGGGTTATYKIAYQSGATAPADCASGTTTTSATTSKAISGLTAATQYSFRICALNGNAAPDASSGVTATATTLQAAPPNPTGEGATVNSSSQITLAWTSGGGSTASYKIAYQTGATAPADCASGTTTTSATTSKAITGLTAATQYSFRVCSLNNNPTPDVSAGVTVSSTTLQAAPPNPTSPGTTADATTQITVAWTSGGGSTATYKIACQSGATAPADCASGTTTTSATTSKAITGLTAATQYAFRICALNGNATPDVSSGVTVSGTTLQDPPAEPTALSATVNSYSQITLNWTSGGGSTASYKIAYQSGGTAPADCASGTVATSAVNSKALTGLTAATQYSFRVCSLNSNSTPDVSSGITVTATTSLQLITSWSFVDGGAATGINKNATVFAAVPVAVSFNSKLYSAWHEKNGSGVEQIRVAVYNGNDASSSWSFVDGNGADGLNKNTAKMAKAPRLAVFNSKLYMIWYERGASVDQIRVAVYNGNDGGPSWSFIDGNGAVGINKNSAQTAYTPDIYVVNSKLYATWVELGTVAMANYQIRVAVYNGNDSSPAWSFVDGNGGIGINSDTTAYTLDPRLIEFNSKLYVTWSEDGGGDVVVIRVAVYNGNDSSPSWSFIDGGTSRGISRDWYGSGYSTFTVANSKLYLSWSETTSAYISKIRVAVYNSNDSSPSWTFVDGNNDNGINKSTTQAAVAPSLAAFGSTVYAAWYERTAAGYYQARVAAYNANDSSPTWTFVDGNGATGLNKNLTHHARNPTLTVFSSKLYITWPEDADFSGTLSQIRFAVGN